MANPYKSNSESSTGNGCFNLCCGLVQHQPIGKPRRAVGFSSLGGCGVDFGILKFLFMGFDPSLLNERWQLYAG